MRHTATIKKHIEGFTFVELSIVIAVIAVIASLALFGYTNQLAKARDTQRKTDVNRIQKLLEEYEKDHSCYPEISDWPGCGSTSGTIFENYIGTIPCDPRTNTEYVYDADTSVCPLWFTVFADFENDNDFTAQEIGCAYESCIPSNSVGVSQGYDYYVSSPNAPLPQGINLPPTPPATPTPTISMSNDIHTPTVGIPPTNTPTATISQETPLPQNDCPFRSLEECDTVCSERGGRCRADDCSEGTYQCVI